MQQIRSNLRSRLFLIVLGCSLLGVFVMLMETEKEKDWKKFQSQYRRLYQEQLEKQIQLFQENGDKEGEEKWRSLYREASLSMGPAIQRIFLPGAGVRDLCTSCHASMENNLFAEKSNPLRMHPQDILTDHPPNRFGCTLCHQGQGSALSVQKAHGYEENWLEPRVPRPYTQGLCFGCHETTYGLKGAEQAEQGRQLFVAYGCFGCHKTRGLDYVSSFATPLTGIGKKINESPWLFGWLRQPDSVRPGTRMPSFRVSDTEIAHLVSYLRQQTTLHGWLTLSTARRGNPKSGKALFTEKGCIACHSVEHKEKGLTERVPNLSDAGLKLRNDWVAAWVADPSKIDPETIMPRVELNGQEQADLVAFLAGQKSSAVRSLLESLPEMPVAGSAQEGRRLVQHFGCYGCHPIEEMAKLPLVGVDVSQVAHKRLEELPFGNASVPQTKWDWLFYKIKQPDIYKTDDMPLKMPDYENIFQKSDEHVIHLTIYYLRNDAYNLPDRYHYRQTPESRTLERGNWMIGQLNCRGCHQFAEDETPRFAGFLSLKSMVPPRLVGEGERVQPQWMFQYLSRPTAMRPWLKTRMPEFNWSYAEKRAMIDYFALQTKDAPQQANQTPYVLLPVRADYDPEVIEMGNYRITTDKCMQCHPVSMDDKLPPDIKEEDLSINLMLSKTRLRYEWIINFLRNPDRYAGKGTKMPFVYYTPDRIPRMPDPEMWIQYTALALMFMDTIPETPEAEQIEDIRPGSDVDWTSY